MTEQGALMMMFYLAFIIAGISSTDIAVRAGALCRKIIKVQPQAFGFSPGDEWLRPDVSLRFVVEIMKGTHHLIADPALRRSLSTLRISYFAAFAAAGYIFAFAALRLFGI